jgi:hypothetical protein
VVNCRPGAFTRALPASDFVPRILFHSDRNRFDHWFQGLTRYLERTGYEVVHVRQNKVAWSFDFQHAFICHGNHQTQIELKRLCDRFGVPWTIAEIGFFPQKNHFFLDRKGINACSALMEDDLAWVTERHLGAYRDFTEAYVGAFRWTRRNRYVFAPLQLEGDSNIALHSPFKTMQAFIDHVEKEFPTESVVFKAHPLDPNRSYRVAPHNTLVYEGQLFELARDAKLVYGINSTVLYESIMQGVPTHAVGDGLLRRHSGREERLVAALVDQQISVSETDYSYWLESYANPILQEPNRARRIAFLAAYRAWRRIRRTGVKTRKLLKTAGTSR